MPITRRFGCCLDDLRGLTCWLGINSLKAVGRVESFLADERMERRLAAVLAADVAGYSLLMGRDEEGTLTQLKAFRKTLVDPTIAAHRGRIVKTTGDGMLVEFASAVDAARCAVEIQRRVAAKNVDVPQQAKVEFRIGIHVGDIIFDNNDIFGDGGEYRGPAGGYRRARRHLHFR